MKKFLLTSVAVLSLSVAAQAQEAAPAPKWSIGGVGTLNFTNTSFGKYWQSGAIPSLAIAGRAVIDANYNSEATLFENRLILAYSTVRQGRLRDSTGKLNPFLKSDDQIDFTSKYGRKLRNKSLTITGLLNFRTQFAPGYRNNEDALAKRNMFSKSFAPAYLNLGIGLEYNKKVEKNNAKQEISLYYTPLNSKMTYVSDTAFARNFMPKDYYGKHFRYELGSYLNVKYKRTFSAAILNNITLQTQADFFLNYIENPKKNIDVNWTVQVGAQVNKYVILTFFTRLVYDDDTRFDIVRENAPAYKAPRTQFQNVLGVGLTYAIGAAAKK